MRLPYLLLLVAASLAILSLSLHPTVAQSPSQTSASTHPTPIDATNLHDKHRHKHSHHKKHSREDSEQPQQPQQPGYGGMMQGGGGGQNPGEQYYKQYYNPGSQGGAGAGAGGGFDYSQYYSPQGNTGKSDSSKHHHTRQPSSPTTEGAEATSSNIRASGEMARGFLPSSGSQGHGAAAAIGAASTLHLSNTLHKRDIEHLQHTDRKERHAVDKGEHAHKHRNHAEEKNEKAIHDVEKKLEHMKEKHEERADEKDKDDHEHHDKEHDKHHKRDGHDDAAPNQKEMAMKWQEIGMQYARAFIPPVAQPPPPPPPPDHHDHKHDDKDHDHKHKHKHHHAIVSAAADLNAVEEPGVAGSLPPQQQQAQQAPAQVSPTSGGEKAEQTQVNQPHNVAQQGEGNMNSPSQGNNAPSQTTQSSTQGEAGEPASSQVLVESPEQKRMQNEWKQVGQQYAAYYKNQYAQPGSHALTAADDASLAERQQMPSAASVLNLNEANEDDDDVSDAERMTQARNEEMARKIRQMQQKQARQQQKQQNEAEHDDTAAASSAPAPQVTAQRTADPELDGPSSRTFGKSFLILIGAVALGTAGVFVYRYKKQRHQYEPIGIEQI